MGDRVNSASKTPNGTEDTKGHGYRSLVAQEEEQRERTVRTTMLPRHGTPYLLGRLVFTLTRMTSQPSLLNMGMPVSSSCRSRSVAVMLRTTLISMFPPVKLEDQAGSTLGISATRGSIPTLFAHTQNLRRQRAGSSPTWEKLGWGLLTATQATFPSPLRQSMKTYTAQL